MLAFSRVPEKPWAADTRRGLSGSLRCRADAAMAIILARFSMASAARIIRQRHASMPVLTSPASDVTALMTKLPHT